MSEPAFDALTRRAADAISRRGSLLALGGAALAAAVARPGIAAKPKPAKKARKICQRHVNPCREVFIEFCANVPDPDACKELAFSCCALLANCNSAGWVQCALEGNAP